MKISDKGKELIKSFEGCKTRSYHLPGELYYTVGYGHTGADVLPGFIYTRAQIDKFFDDDIKKFEENVMKYNDIYKWNQNEFDALVSFAYNCSSIDYLVARGVRSREEIRGVWLAYCHDSRGEVLEGLRRRRMKELELFNTPIDTIMDSSIEGGFNGTIY